MTRDELLASRRWWRNLCKTTTIAPVWYSHKVSARFPVDDYAFVDDEPVEPPRDIGFAVSLNRRPTHEVTPEAMLDRMIDVYVEEIRKELASEHLVKPLSEGAKLVLRATGKGPSAMRDEAAEVLAEIRAQIKLQQSRVLHDAIYAEFLRTGRWRQKWEWEFSFGQWRLRPRRVEMYSRDGNV